MSEPSKKRKLRTLTISSEPELKKTKLSNNATESFLNSDSEDSDINNDNNTNNNETQTKKNINSKKHKQIKQPSKPIKTNEEKEDKKKLKKIINENLKWSTLECCENTMKAINSLGFETMMEIQAKAIPHVLNGCDLAGAAKTGSGKTLAFVVPCVEILSRNEWNKNMGTGAIIISPTRELALQIKGVAMKISQYHRNIKVNVLIGGSSKYAEAQMLKMGCAIISATPGRLMDHLESTTFRFDLLKLLIIDEADYILDIGFEHQMHCILKILPIHRQTLLFSATLTEKTKDLVTLAFRKKPVFVRASGTKQQSAAADNLIQYYSILTQDKKLCALLTWLRRHKNEKILIFFSTKKSVQFYEKLFRSIGIKILALYGGIQQNLRTSVFFEFVKLEYGILLATNVASRGLDFPAVHWVVQYDPPQDPKEYIHRVGRTSRAGLKGEALTFLQPTELSYLELLKECNLQLKKIEIKEVDYNGLNIKLNDVVSSNNDLINLANDACKTFVRAYDQRANTIFNNNGVNRNLAAISFCLKEYPKNSDINIVNNNEQSSYGGRGYQGFNNKSRGNRGRGRGRGGRGRGRGKSRGRGRGNKRGRRL